MIVIDKQYFRPLEVDYLRGDSSKAFKKLSFEPKYNLNSLIQDMLESDLIIAKNESKLKD